jgi:hypothetical protein
LSTKLPTDRGVRIEDRTETNSTYVCDVQLDTLQSRSHFTSVEISHEDRKYLVQISPKSKEIEDIDPIAAMCNKLYPARLHFTSVEMVRKVRARYFGIMWLKCKGRKVDPTTCDVQQRSRYPYSSFSSAQASLGTPDLPLNSKPTHQNPGASNKAISSDIVGSNGHQRMVYNICIVPGLCLYKNSIIHPHLITNQAQPVNHSPFNRH